MPPGRSLPSGTGRGPRVANGLDGHRRGHGERRRNRPTIGRPASDADQRRGYITVGTNHLTVPPATTQDNTACCDFGPPCSIRRHPATPLARSMGITVTGSLGPRNRHPPRTEPQRRPDASRQHPSAIFGLSFATIDRDLAKIRKAKSPPLTTPHGTATGN